MGKKFNTDGNIKIFTCHLRGFFPASFGNYTSFFASLHRFVCDGKPIARLPTLFIFTGALPSPPPYRNFAKL